MGDDFDLDGGAAGEGRDLEERIEHHKRLSAPKFLLKQKGRVGPQTIDKLKKLLKVE